MKSFDVVAQSVWNHASLTTRHEHCTLVQCSTTLQWKKYRNCSIFRLVALRGMAISTFNRGIVDKPNIKLPRKNECTDRDWQTLLYIDCCTMFALVCFVTWLYLARINGPVGMEREFDDYLLDPSRCLKTSCQEAVENFTGLFQRW